MGRSIYTDQVKTHPPGFFLEVNSSLMEGLWAALALEKHPEVADEHHNLERTFELCRDVTWADFWHAFPYKLREGGSYIDELDAMGLLLSTSVSKQRFQRYFEQYAGSSTSSTAQHSTRPLQDPTQQQQPQRQQQRRRDVGFRLGFRLDQPGGDREVHRRALPLRYRGQYQQHYQPQQQQQQQQLHEDEVFWQALRAHDGPGSRLVQPATANHVAYVPPRAVRRSPSAAAATGGIRAQAPGTDTGRAAAPAIRPGSERLIGRRRTWTEVCEEGGAPSPAAAAVEEGPQPVAAADADAAAENPPAANPSQQRQQQQEGNTVNNSSMWRAVHDWLTADDEPLLVVVSRLVPYNFKGLLRDVDVVKQQLQQLASSRHVPQKVVSAISDRFSATSDNNLVHLTASSGYSRRAAAAAAALACSNRVPYHISLAGLYREEDIESAIMQGLFVEGVSRPLTPESPPPAAAAAAAGSIAAPAAVPAAEPVAADAEAAPAAAVPSPFDAPPMAIALAQLAAARATAGARYRTEVLDIDESEDEEAADAADAAYLEGAPPAINFAAIQRVAAAAAQRAVAAAAADRALQAGDLDTAIARQQEAAAATAALAAAGTTTEERVAQMEQELGVEFEAGFSLQQRVRILEALRARREARAAMAAAQAPAAAAAEPAAAAAAPAAEGTTGLRFRQVHLAAARAAANRQQQQQQQQNEEPSEPEDEGFDRMFGFLAGTGGLGVGPGRPTARRTERRRRTTPPAVHVIGRSPGFQEYSDATDEDDGVSQGSEEGSDDGDQGLGIWRVEPREQRIGGLNPAGGFNPLNPTADDLLEHVNLLEPRPMGGRGIFREGSVHRGFRCGEQFAAHMTLLGTCYKQPLLLLLDEADSALVAGDGQGFRQLVTKLMCMLPQAVVVVLSSFKSKAFTDSAAFLRQQGREARYDLGDGHLSIVCRRVPKTLYYRCFM